MLLVLDNVEQVVGQAGAVVDLLLSEAPDLQLLATSRERLGLRGEHRVGLGPLTESDARKLFEQRAGARRASFRRDAADDALLSQIVARLDNLPLAIELAAARCDLLSLQQISERLRDR